MNAGGARWRPERLRQSPVADRGRPRPEVADRRRRLQIEACGKRVETEEDVGSDFFSVLVLDPVSIFLFLCWIWLYECVVPFDFRTRTFIGWILIQTSWICWTDLVSNFIELFYKIYGSFSISCKNFTNVCNQEVSLGIFYSDLCYL
jgi:hypothetical protein